MMFASGRSRQAGAALILVLWTFTVLSALAAEFARAMRQEAQSTRNFKEDTVSRYVAVAGLNEAILAIQAFNGEFDNEDDLDDEPGAQEEEEDARTQAIRSLLEGRGDWVEGTFNGIKYEVRAVDEGGKIPLNATAVDEELLRRIMDNLGYEELVASTVADSILDWRDEDDLHRVEGAEDDYYDGLKRPYQSKDAPFSAIEELLFVRGVTREMFHGDDETPGLKEIFSALSRYRHINVGTVGAAVEHALCGITDEDDENAGGLGSESVDEEADLATCLSTTGLGSRRGNTSRLALSTATVEARVKDENERVLTHVGVAVHFKSGGFRTIQWYDSIFSDEG